MNITQNCPHCARPLRLAAEHAGRRIRCPGCSEVFRVGLEESVEAVADDATLPPPQSAKLERTSIAVSAGLPQTDEAPPGDRKAFHPAWGLVRQVLNLIHYGVLINVLGTLLAVAFMLGAAGVAADVPRESRSFFLVVVVGMLVVFGLVALTAFFMIQIGLGCCCCAPHESKAKGLAIATLMVSLNTWPLLFVSRVVEMGFRSDYPEGPEVKLLPFTLTFGTLSGVAVTVLFVLFLRGLARHFDNQRLVASVRNYLIFYAGVLGLFALVALVGVVLPLLFSGADDSTPRTQRSTGWEARERHQEDDGSGLELFEGWLGVVAVLAGVAALLFVAGINVVWLLGLIRRTRDTIARVEKDALPAPT